jgi:predicted HTH transcriptional regulator
LPELLAEAVFFCALGQVTGGKENSAVHGGKTVSVKIELFPDRLVFSNPGTIRLGKKQMLHGGITSPRNKAILNMFNYIGVGERAGSGVPNIYDIWEKRKQHIYKSPHPNPKNAFGKTYKEHREFLEFSFEEQYMM